MHGNMNTRKRLQTVKTPFLYKLLRKLVNLTTKYKRIKRFIYSLSTRSRHNMIFYCMGICVINLYIWNNVAYRTVMHPSLLPC